MKKVVLSIAFVLFFVVGVFFVFQGLQFMYPDGNGEQVIFEVPPGESLRTVARRLELVGLVNNQDYFVYLSKLTGKSRNIRVGQYGIKSGSTPLQILTILSSGRSVEYSITIPEGTNMYEIAQMLEKAGLGKKREILVLFKNKEFIKSLLGKSLYSLEGYLFPDTYFYTKYSTLKGVVKKMVQTFLDAYKEIEPLEKKIGMNRHEIVILASIVEKETGVPHERHRISSVFHNRIKKKMRLQTDPTVLYGVLDITEVMKKNITRKDLKTKTAYNTYRINGLPKGPISNPGIEALKATVQPETSPYLYFVSRNDGTHVFSETYDQHNRAVRKFQLDPSMRRGRSWRDYNKKN